jgi:hypothetical protein
MAFVPQSQGVTDQISMVPARKNTAQQNPSYLFLPNPKLRLREQFHEVMRYKHYSVRTEETYWGWIRLFKHVLLSSSRIQFGAFAECHSAKQPIANRRYAAAWSAGFQVGGGSESRLQPVRGRCDSGCRGPPKGGTPNSTRNCQSALPRSHSSFVFRRLSLLTSSDTWFHAIRHSSFVLSLVTRHLSIRLSLLTGT